MKKRKCKAKIDLWSHTKQKKIVTGTLGEILGQRNIKGHPEVLIKFKGFWCPISCKLKNIILEKG